MTREQLDILNEIKVKMYYDPKKTLSEQETRFTRDFERGEMEKLSPEASQTKAEETGYPIPGHTSYYTPCVGNPDGGRCVMYFPLNISKIQKNTITTPEMFKRPEAFQNIPDTIQILEKILPPGTIREFRIGEDYYTLTVAIDRSNPNQVKLVFNGYKNQDGEKYVSPNPEDYKSSWEKFLDDFGGLFQLIGSVVVLVLIGSLTSGLGLSLGFRIALEILGELLINIPVAAYEYKKGESSQAQLSLLFSLLPLLNMEIWGKSITKEMFQSISQKLAQSEIKSGDDLAKFYNTLTEEEKYAFSRVMQQQPDRLKKIVEEGTKKILDEGLRNKEIIQKVLLKHQNWWKDLGVQGGLVFMVMTVKSLMPNRDLSQQEIERMERFAADIEEQLNRDEQRILQQRMMKDENFAREVVEIALLPQGKEYDDFFVELGKSLRIDSVNNTSDSTEVSQTEDIK
jgi:hypothetical protein